MLTNKDLKKFHSSAERVTDAMQRGIITGLWDEKDALRLQSVIAKELINMDRAGRGRK